VVERRSLTGELSLQLMGKPFAVDQLGQLSLSSEDRRQASTRKTTEDVFGIGVICMWKPMDRSRDSEAVRETRGASVDRQRLSLIRHYNRTGQVGDWANSPGSTPLMTIKHHSVQGGAKNRASISHCKYSENFLTKLRGNW